MWLSIVAAIFFVIQNLANKLFSMRFKKTLYSLSLLIAISLVMGTAILGVLTRPSVPDTGSMLYAALFGLLFDTTICMISVTISRGPLGLSNLIIDMSIVVSVLFAVLVWKESMSWLQGAALVILMAVLVAIALPEKKEEGRINISWLVIALVTMLFNGSLSVVQKAAFTRAPELSSADFTFWCVAMGAAISVVMALVMKLFAHSKLEAGESAKHLSLYAVGVGVGTAFAYYFQNWALTTTDSIVVFPVVIGLNVSLLMVSGVLFFKERMSLRKAIAFVAGMAGILMMGF